MGGYAVFRIDENKLVWGNFKEIEIGCINDILAFISICYLFVVVFFLGGGERWFAQVDMVQLLCQGF